MRNDLKRCSRFKLTKEIVDVLKQSIIASLNMKCPLMYRIHTVHSVVRDLLLQSQRSKSTRVIDGLYLILAASLIPKEVPCADDGTDYFSRPL